MWDRRDRLVDREVSGTEDLLVSANLIRLEHSTGSTHVHACWPWHCLLATPQAVIDSNSLPSDAIGSALPSNVLPEYCDFSTHEAGGMLNNVRNYSLVRRESFEELIDPSGSTSGST